MLVFAFACLTLTVSAAEAVTSTDCDGSVQLGISAAQDDSLVTATVSDTDVSKSETVNNSLKIMGQGMLGIFIVMVLIYVVILILNAATNKKEEK